MMRKFIAALMVLSSTMVGSIHGQSIRAFVSAGGNLSQIDGDEVYGFKKAGFTGSFLFSHSFTPQRQMNIAPWLYASA